jgi:hypothetical protein
LQEKAKAARVKKAARTRDFWVVLREIASISVHFGPVLGATQSQVAICGRLEGSFRFSRRRQTGSGSSFDFKEKGSSAAPSVSRGT